MRKGGTLECFTLDKPIEPLPLPRVSDAVAITSSDELRCVIHRGGEVSCGRATNQLGELGDGTFTQRAVLGPRVVGLTDAVRVSASVDHACAVRRGGQVLCWGDDGEGQVSATAHGMERAPVRVLGLPSP